MITSVSVPAWPGVERDYQVRHRNLQFASAVEAISVPPTMNAVVIDDDSVACELLCQLLARVAPDLHVVARAATVPDARAVLEQTVYDAVFLDVQLIGGSGFDLVPFVHPDAAIIFVTGRDDHAVRAFEVNAMDYIVKPVTAARLNHAMRQLGHGSADGNKPVAKLAPGDNIFLRGASAGGRFVPLRAVAAILSSENYTEVLLDDGERWFIRRPLQTWAEMLPAEIFHRVHRTAIVNVGAIDRIERSMTGRTELKLRGVRQPVAVSRAVWSQLRVRLAGRFVR